MKIDDADFVVSNFCLVHHGNNDLTGILPHTLVIVLFLAPIVLINVQEKMH